MKNPVVVVPDAVFCAEGVEKVAELPVVGTAQLVGTAVGADGPLLDAGEFPVQLGVVVLPAAVAERHAHAEVDDATYPRLGAAFHDAPDVFGGVVEPGEDGAQPHHRGDAALLTFLQHLDALLGGADPRLDELAEPLVHGGQGHLHHRLAPAIDPLQNVQIPQNEVGFRQDGDAAAMPLDDLQGTAGHLQLFLDGRVGVGHGPGADHTGSALALQGCRQQRDGVLLHRHVLKAVVHVVAAAPGVAVDAPVLAAPVEVHAVFG